MQHPAAANSVPSEEVALGNTQGQQVGVEDKQRAHLDGALHRAISIFVFNAAGELLMQQRAACQCTFHALRGNDLIDHEVDHVFVGSFEVHPEYPGFRPGCGA